MLLVLWLGGGECAGHSVLTDTLGEVESLQLVVPHQRALGTFKREKRK